LRWRRALSTVGRGWSGVFEAHPGTPIPPALLCLPITNKNYRLLIFVCLFESLKSVDIIFISAKIGLISGLFELARNHNPWIAGATPNILEFPLFSAVILNLTWA
jgi:hypothetical protein